MRLSVIPIADRLGWESAQAGLDPPPTQGWAYNRILAEAFDLPMELFVAEGAQGRATCPLFRRPIGEGPHFDLATPVGFGGFAGQGALPGLGAAWRTFWRAEGAVTAYIQLHPLTAEGLLEGPLAELAVDAGPGPVTVVLPLAGLTSEDILAGMRRDHRSRIRQWLAREGRYELHQAALADAFVEMFPAFRDERGMGALYRLPEPALRDLTELDACWMVGARGEDGGVEAVSMFLFSPAGGDYHLNAARGDGRRHARALVWRAILEALDRGLPALHLSGGVASGDSLDEFKTGFGGRREASAVLRCVLDPDAYRALCSEAGLEAGTDGYFPAYRRPR
jgi:hypothetical protein